MELINLLKENCSQDDIEFIMKHADLLSKYEHGILTLLGSPVETLLDISKNPRSVPGWKEYIKRSADDENVLKELFSRISRSKTE